MKTTKPRPEPLGQLEAQPAISYARALRARFVWQGETHIVSSCPLEVLYAFLLHYGELALANKPFKLQEAMSCLDGDYGDLGRWQCLDTLLFYRVVLPLQYDA